MTVATDASPSSKSIDTVWLIMTGIGILFMQVGFLMLETGWSQAKNVKSIILKGLMDHSVGAVVWVLVGWGLFQGNNPFAGGSDSVFYSDPPRNALVFQQFGFAVTASAIVSGAVLGRCRLSVYVFNSAILTAITYPIQAHASWDTRGWLAQMGFKDFAGSGVVHLFGGSCALVAAWACGPRVGRFGRSTMFLEPKSQFGKRAMRFSTRWCGTASTMKRIVCVLTGNGDPLLRVREFPPHNTPLVALGAMLLYVAWFSFNAGSGWTVTAEADSADQAARAAINTLVAAGAGTTAGLAWSMVFHPHQDVAFVCNCLLGGLVAVTGPSGFVDVWAAITVGCLAVPVMVLFCNLVTHGFRVDDAVGAAGVHGGCGLLGIVWVGLAHTFPRLR
jgi:Amt family ammonium transporter